MSGVCLSLEFANEVGSRRASDSCSCNDSLAHRKRDFRQTYFDLKYIVPGHRYMNLLKGRMQLLFAGTPKKEKEDGQTQTSIHSVTWTSLTVFVRGVAGTKGYCSQISNRMTMIGAVASRAAYAGRRALARNFATVGSQIPSVELHS
jgi:hypothetical protein